MNKEDFQALLEDLYRIYNPSKMQDIQTLLEKYNGQEFDAVKTIFIRYNFRASPSSNPDIGTDKHVKRLIQGYSEKDRILQKGMSKPPSQSEIIERKIDEAREK